MVAAEEINGEAQNYRNTAFRMEVGEKDYQYGRADYAGIWQLEMKALHEQWPEDFVHEVNLQARQGHEIDYTKVIPWLLNYTRRHYPKRITYRYYDLDGKDSYAAGVYYLGFQNLQPEKGAVCSSTYSTMETALSWKPKQAKGRSGAASVSTSARWISRVP